MATGTLRAIKLLHTLVWFFFVACIVAIPVSAASGRFSAAVGFIAIVLIEVLVLAFNRCRCPLTLVAERHTGDRSDNFDIYLPEWLARHNQVIFGLLYLFGVLFTIAEWFRTQVQ